MALLLLLHEYQSWLLWPLLATLLAQNENVSPYAPRGVSGNLLSAVFRRVSNNRSVNDAWSVGKWMRGLFEFVRFMPTVRILIYCFCPAKCNALFVWRDIPETCHNWLIRFRPCARRLRYLSGLEIRLATSSHRSPAVIAAAVMRIQFFSVYFTIISIDSKHRKIT